MSTVGYPNLQQAATGQLPQGPGAMQANAPTGNAGWVMFLVMWAIMCVAAVAAVSYAGNLPLAIILAVPITLIGIMWKPVFGLCMIVAVLPIGRAIGHADSFSLERGLAVLLLIGVLVNMIMKGKRLRVRSPVTFGLASLTLLSLFSVTWAKYPRLAGLYSFTLFQILALLILILIVCENPWNVIWALRTFAAACLFAGLSGLFLGVDLSETQRFTVAVSQDKAMNPNHLACIFGLAFFAAIYLFRRDPARWTRMVWATCIGLMPIMIIFTASRKAILAIAVTIALPFFSIKGFSRAPGLRVVMLILLLIGGFLFIKATQFAASEETITRITDPEYAQNSYQQRMGFIKASLDYVGRNPLGAGMGCFYEQQGKVVHNDFFYIFSNLGYAGAIAFVCFALSMLFYLHRIPQSPEKLFCLSVMVFLFIEGMAATWIFAKHYWIVLILAAQMVPVQAYMSARNPEPTVEYLEG